MHAAMCVKPQYLFLRQYQSTPHRQLSKQQRQEILQHYRPSQNLPRSALGIHSMTEAYSAAGKTYLHQQMENQKE